MKRSRSLIAGLYTSSPCQPAQPKPLPIRHSTQVLLSALTQNIPPMEEKLKQALGKEMITYMLQNCDAEGILQAFFDAARDSDPYTEDNEQA